ncbi:hypothetical protein GIB67_034114 [Kingdonia uniflora]|uniref:Uncharacterized protein n=1 Tax=Kingdonia uniflora TaxID=39325 RepID=A0A7J7M6B6_9MAGN|nr:hypothetical protein GIB67_034114 [Kingdonia uniflora]
MGCWFGVCACWADFRVCDCGGLFGFALLVIGVCGVRNYRRVAQRMRGVIAGFVAVCVADFGCGADLNSTSGENILWAGVWALGLGSELVLFAVIILISFRIILGVFCVLVAWSMRSIVDLAVVWNVGFHVGVWWFCKVAPSPMMLESAGLLLHQFVETVTIDVFVETVAIDVVACGDLWRAGAEGLLLYYYFGSLVCGSNRLRYVEGRMGGVSLTISNAATEAGAHTVTDIEEAYEEFKHVLLALIYGKDDQTSPFANEWMPCTSSSFACYCSNTQILVERLGPALQLNTNAYIICELVDFKQFIAFMFIKLHAISSQWAVIRRFETAGLLSYVLRAYLSACDPIFSMTLRNLISIHKGFCLRQDISSQISDLTERLLLEECDPPPVPQESLYEAPPFDEVDIQALAHVVELTRQGAADSLWFSKGNLFQAFQNEICRTKLNVKLLDELVHEYCVYRGLVEGGITSSFSGILSVSNNDFIDDSSKETNVEAMVIDSTELGYINEIAVKHSGVEIITSKEDDKYEFVLEMKELASKVIASEVVEEVDATYLSFFVLNPHLLFQLKQVEFLKLVKCGDHSGSLRIACSYLGPLAATNPTLLKPLKETLLVLLKPNEDPLDKGIPFSVLASSLQVAMGRRLGVDEPLLMKLMGATLHTHNEWFRLQMCKDRFEGLLKIDSLKEIKTPLIIDDVFKKRTDNSTHGSS